MTLSNEKKKRCLIGGAILLFCALLALVLIWTMLRGSDDYTFRSIAVDIPFEEDCETISDYYEVVVRELAEYCDGKELVHISGGMTEPGSFTSLTFSFFRYTGPFGKGKTIEHVKIEVETADNSIPSLSIYKGPDGKIGRSDDPIPLEGLVAGPGDVFERALLEQEVDFPEQFLIFGVSGASDQAIFEFSTIGLTPEKREEMRANS